MPDLASGVPASAAARSPSMRVIVPQRYSVSVAAAVPLDDFGVEDDSRADALCQIALRA